VLSTQQPDYLCNFTSYHQSSHLLPSSSQSLQHLPRIKIDFGHCVFSSAVPQTWNHVPTAVRRSPSLDSFKHHLKLTTLPRHNTLTTYWLPTLCQISLHYITILLTVVVHQEIRTSYSALMLPDRQQKWHPVWNGKHPARTIPKSSQLGKSAQTGVSQ